MIEAPVPRAVLITGAARRIGRAVAIDFARQGWAVAVHYNGSKAEADDVVETIAAGGRPAVALQADLADEAEAAQLVERAAAALGPIGCLVNNASPFERDEALTATRLSWDTHMETGLRAPFVLSQAFARALPADAEGVIVNMLDQRVWSLTPHFVSYTLAKSGLWTLTRTLALAFAPRIRVNGVGPGPTLPSARQTAAQFARQAASVPLGRATTLEEICLAVRFLVAAPSVTGQMIAVDGGQHLQWSPARQAALDE